MIYLWQWSRDGLVQVAGGQTGHAPTTGAAAGPPAKGSAGPPPLPAAGATGPLAASYEQGGDRAVLWIDVRDPEPRDWAVLRRRYQLAPLLWNRLEEGSTTYGVEAAGDTVVFHVPMPSRRSSLVMVTAWEVATVCEGDGDPWQRLRERLAAGGATVSPSGPWLLYFLLEDVLHDYGDQVQLLEQRLEPVEARFLGEGPVAGTPGARSSTRSRRGRPMTDPGGVSLLSTLHRRAGQLQRRLNILSEVLDRLVEFRYNGERQRIGGREVDPYLRTLCDHASRLGARLENARELVVTLMNLRLALAAERTNRLILRLTALSTVFLPLTFLTGIYGMNFRHMPELGWPWAYPVLLAFMLVLGVFLWWFFRREYEGL